MAPSPGIDHTSALAPTPATAVCNAEITYVQNATGSLSAASSDSQATDFADAGEAASDAASSVVFPKPAGPGISVSFARAPCVSRS